MTPLEYYVKLNFDGAIDTQKKKWRDGVFTRIHIDQIIQAYAPKFELDNPLWPEMSNIGQLFWLKCSDAVGHYL